jgi:hypothetical protein
VTDTNKSVIFDLDLAFIPVVGAMETVAAFQSEAYTKLADLIRRQLAQAASIADAGPADESRPTQFVHNAILVSGSRGSGKSTFLHGLAGKSAIPEAEGGRAPRVTYQVQWLPVLDPTLVESGEHPLITLISRLNGRVQAHPSHDAKTTRAYEDALRDLAGSLAGLEGVGPPELYRDWEDPDVIVEGRLEKAVSGTVLAGRVDALVRAAARVVGCDAFGIILDDVDTHFDKGWPVIEMLRRYLTSQRLVVVIAGDIDLYSKLVRAAQYRNFGAELLRNDRAHRDHHRDEDRQPWQEDRIKRLVDELEAQYLMKVVKPENRVALRTLAELCPAKLPTGPEVVLRADKADLGPLRKCVERIMKRALNLRRAEDLREHVDAVLQLPVRTVAQILRVGVELAKGAEPDSAAIVIFRRGFAEVASSSLLHNGVQPSTLNAADGDTLTRMVIEWIDNADLWEDGHTLRPRYADAHLNLTAMAFAMRAVTLFASGVHEALRYLVRVGFTRMVVRQGVGRTTARLEAKSVSRAELLDFLQLGSSQSLADFGRRLTAAQRSVTPTGPVRMGTVQVVSGEKARTVAGALANVYGPPEGGESKWTRDSFLRWANGPFVTSEDKDPYHLAEWLKTYQATSRAGAGGGYNTIGTIASASRFGPLAHLATSRYQTQTASSACVSMLPMVAAIGAALDAISEGREIDPKLVDVPTFMLGDPKEEQTKGNETDEDEEAPEGDTSGDDPEDWRAALKFPGGFTAPKCSHHPKVLAAIVDRFDMALRALDGGLVNREYQTGYLLERQLLAFLNATLAEELTEGDVANVDFKSVVRTHDPYLRNLGKLKTLDLAPLHQTLINVPALHHFVRDHGQWCEDYVWKKSKTKTKRWQVSKDLKLPQIGGPSLWIQLNTVPVNGRSLSKNLLTQAPDGGSGAQAGAASAENSSLDSDGSGGAESAGGQNSGGTSDSKAKATKPRSGQSSGPAGT